MQKKDIKDILDSGMTPLLIKMESRRLEKLLTIFLRGMTGLENTQEKAKKMRRKRS